MNGLGSRRPFHLSPVGLGVAELGIGQPVLESAVVGEQDKPFAIVIESADGVDIRNRDIVGQGAFVLFGSRELADYVEGLVEKDVLQPLMLNYE